MTDQTAAQPDKPIGPFLTIWTGQVFSLLGSEIVQFALIWYLTVRATSTGNSATVLTLATAFQMLPTVLAGPFVGALIDRWNRRLTMIGADGLVAVSTIVLALLFAFDKVEIWHIYAIMLIRAAGQTFHRPAMQATTPLMVPDKHLTRIGGLNQILNGGLTIISAPIGTALYGLLPMHNILMVDIVTAGIAISPLLFIKVPQPERTPESSANTVLQDMVAGFRYVWSWTGLMIILVMAALINFLLNPAFALLPLLVSQHLGKSAIEFGWMNSAFGIGVIAGGLTLSIWGGFKKKILTSMSGLMLMGVGVLALGLIPSNGFILALAAMAFTGIMMPFTNGGIGALVQSAAAPEMQGRIFAVVGSFAMGLSLISTVLSGPIADALGVQSWFVAGGVVCMLMAVAGLVIPAVRNIEEDANARKGESAPASEELASDEAADLALSTEAALD